ncbi:rhodanese-like domain-containing protein, partial [Frankia casuarinae]
GSTITAGELKSWLDAGEPIELVDVREPAEWEIVRIPGARLIPKGDLPAHLSELPQHRRVVVYCKSGVRSADALATLKGAGFSSAVHVQGGVTAWAIQVDKSLPVY